MYHTDVATLLDPFHVVNVEGIKQSVQGRYQYVTFARVCLVPVRVIDVDDVVDLGLAFATDSDQPGVDYSDDAQVCMAGPVSVHARADAQLACAR